MAISHSFSRLLTLAHLRWEKGIGEKTRINKASAHKKLKAQLDHLPELDTQAPYPVLGILSQFIAKLIHLNSRKGIFSNFINRQNLKELRGILYGVESAKNKALDSESIAKLTKRKTIDQHQSSIVQFQDPINGKISELKIDYFKPSKLKTDIPVAVMHGIYSGPRDMVQVIRELTGKGHPVIIFSYPGFASTNRSYEAKSIVSATLSIFKKIKENGFHTINLLAHSLGAGIAAKTLSQIKKTDLNHPNFNNIVFVAPFDSSETNLQKIVDRLIESYENLNESHRPLLLKVIRKIFASAWNTAANLKIATRNLDIKQISIISGGRDAICDRETAEKMAQATNTITHIHKPDSGHFTMFERERMPYDEIVPALVA